MAANVEQSKIMAQLKAKAKGGWARARKVEPKARGAGGFPPGLKNAVAKVVGYKFDKTALKTDAKGVSTGGDPFFMLNVVGVEPDEVSGKRASVSWFLNESQYSTFEENQEALANDLMLLGFSPDDKNRYLPDDIGDIPQCMQQLVDEECHILVNTSVPKTAGKLPNLYVQGLAEGYQPAANNGAPAAEAVEGEAGEVVEEVVEEAGGDVPFVPEIGDQYSVPLGKAEAANCEVTGEPREKDGFVMVKMLAGPSEGKSFWVDPNKFESYIDEPEPVPEPEPVKPTRKPAAAKPKGGKGGKKK